MLEALARAVPPQAPGAARWLSDDTLVPYPRPVRRFGTLAVFGVDARQAEGGGLAPAAAAPAIWVPPSRVEGARALLDGAGDVVEAARRIDAAEDERLATLDALGAYVEELAGLAAAGAPPPPGPWCDVAPDERRRLLAAHGVEGRFTR
jgi:hypothetical protein